MEITQLELLTTDINAQRAFYTTLLGLPLIADSQNRITIQAGSTRLVFTHTDTVVTPTYHFAFNIPEHQFAEAKQWLEQRVTLLGTESDPPDRVFHSQSWNADSIYFYDAAGNVAELIARHTLRDSATEPFSGHSIRRIDEIGLPTPDVISTVQAIQDRTGFTVWNTTLNDVFVPVGDEHGLFIVVKTGRVWLATGDLESQVAPITVAIRHAAGEPFSLPDLPYHIHTIPH